MAPNTEGKKVRRSIHDRRIYYICPKCGKPIEFLKKSHGRSLCRKCGQRLLWDGLDEMPVVKILAQDSGEAEYWLERYESMNGTLYGIDLSAWVKERRPYPTVMFFVFPETKMYSQFIRLASKENALAKGESPGDA